MTGSDRLARMILSDGLVMDRAFEQGCTEEQRLIRGWSFPCRAVREKVRVTQTLADSVRSSR